MSFRDNTAVLRESIRVSVIVWSFACLWKNAVEIWMIGYKGGGKIFGEDRYSFHVTDWGNMIHVRFLFVLFFG